MAPLSWGAPKYGQSLEQAAVLDSIWLQNLSRNVNRVVWVKQAEIARLLKNHPGETKAFSEWSVSGARQMLCLSFLQLTWGSFQDSLASPEPVQEGLKFSLPWEEVTLY